MSLLATALSGCVQLHQARLGVGEAPTLIGPAVRDNRTPMDPALACLAGAIVAAKARPPVIGVGDVRDYTGKYSVSEGNAITQGGALMVTSALGKLGGAVGLAERFDPTIAERELGYTDRRQLGDGEIHDVAGQTGTGKVPWLPYYGGTIRLSDYYIVGGITELNYDIRSGGIDTEVGQLGPKARIFTQGVAIDLRIVDTRSLLVVKTVSLTKQFTGYEVGFNLFRFFGSDLFDINAGAKGQEPLQLGIRTALEEATLRLVAAVTRIEPGACLASQSWAAMPTAGTAPRGADIARSPTTMIGAAFNAAPAGSGRSGDGVVQVPFEVGSAELAGAALALVDRIVVAQATGPVEVAIVARDTETPDPGKRDALADQRIAALIAALAARGIAAGAVTLLWRADSAESAVHRNAPGLQDIARLRIGH
ncbi:MAG: CsgG/HfaB family protein [Sphingomonas sp.]|uniref:CsgG/HfaB family protein n=1 Tax=Sphingomonas sp. TaxID=28214 RepID=UPI0035660365